MQEKPFSAFTVEHILVLPPVAKPRTAARFVSTQFGVSASRYQNFTSACT